MENGHHLVDQAMHREPKVVLQLPISDRGLLAPFVEQCLHDNVSLIAIYGSGCREIEDLIDELIVGDRTGDSRFIATTSHPDESLEDVIEFASNYGNGADGETRLIKL
jgi:hypothetical protein